MSRTCHGRVETTRWATGRVEDWLEDWARRVEHHVGHGRGEVDEKQAGVHEERLPDLEGS